MVASFCLVVALAEVLLLVRDWYLTTRTAQQAQHEDSPFEFSTSRHHRLIPNARYRHHEVDYDYIWANNSLGMRDRERASPKDPGSFRILFLGDSMVQGYGVPQEQTMVALMEASLNEPEREKRVEVVNGGVFGYSPLLERLYLQELMPLVEPDLVIVGFFLGNDVGDDYFYAQQARTNEADGSIYFEDALWPWTRLNEVIRTTDTGPDPSQKPAAEVGLSAYSRPIKERLKRLRIVRAALEVRDRRRVYLEYRERKEREKQAIEQHQDDIRINLGLVNYPVLNRDQRLQYWQLSKSNLALMQRLCKQSRIPMVLVVIPVLEPEVNRFNEPYEILDQFARELSVPVIHLLPAFRKWSVDELTYELDGHWTPLANEVAATSLDQNLRSLDLLPLRRHR